MTILTWAVVLLTLGVWGLLILGAYVFCRFVRAEDKLMREVSAESLPGIHIEKMQGKRTIWQIWHKMGRDVAVQLYDSDDDGMTALPIDAIRRDIGYVEIHFGQPMSNVTAIITGESQLED